MKRTLNVHTSNERKRRILLIAITIASMLLFNVTAEAQTATTICPPGTIQVLTPEDNIVRQIPEQNCIQQTPTLNQTPTSIPVQAPLTQTPQVIPEPAPAGDTPTQVPDQTAGDVFVQTPEGGLTQTPVTVTPGETPVQTPGDIMVQIPQQTPTQAPGETPAQTPSEMPAQTPAEIPTESPNLLTSESGRQTMLIALLNGGQAIPANSTSAFGQAFLVLDRDTRMLCETLSFTELTSEQTFARIQGPARPGEGGPILFELTPATAGSSNECVGPLTEQQVTDLTEGRMYLNVGNATFPNGEIRGQIIPVFRATANGNGGNQTGTQAPPAQMPQPQVPTSIPEESENGGTTNGSNGGATTGSTTNGTTSGG
jgi:hypothetical protein